MTEATTRPRSAPRAERRDGPAGGRIIALLLLGHFMAILDVNIVNVALPTLRTDLRASGSGLQLVVAGYVIAFAVLLITGARLGRLHGHRRVFHLGLAVFTLASLACGLAPTTWSLVAFRFLQGAGAALMSPQVMSILQQTFTGAARGRALGLYSAVTSGGVVVGQIAGGLLVSADLFGAGWRTVFLVNVPLGVLLLAAGPRVLPRDEGRRDGGLDLPGLLVLTPAVLLLTVPLILGHELGWPVWGWVSLAAAGALLPVFVAVERGVAARGGRPLISGRVLRSPGLPLALAVLVCGPGSWGSFLFTTTLHLQGDLEMTPLQSGLAFVPCVAAFGLVGLTWQRIPAGWHRWTVAAGFLLAAAGYAFVGPLAGGGVPYELLTAVIGLGLGVLPIVMTAALRHVPADAAADASGLMLTVMQLGQVVGVATIGTLFLTLARDGGSTRHAEYATGWALAGAALAGAAFAVVLARRTR
ncbi:MFS transporter [Actinomadura vinacea]